MSLVAAVLRQRNPSLLDLADVDAVRIGAWDERRARVLDRLVAPRCSSCGRALPESASARGGRCWYCRKGARPPAPRARCINCGAPLRKARERCPACEPVRPAVVCRVCGRRLNAQARPGGVHRRCRGGGDARA